MLFLWKAGIHGCGGFVHCHGRDWGKPTAVRRLLILVFARLSSGREKFVPSMTECRTIFWFAGVESGQGVKSTELSPVFGFTALAPLEIFC